MADKSIVTGCTIPKTVLPQKNVIDTKPAITPQYNLNKGNIGNNLMMTTCPSCHGKGHTMPMMMVDFGLNDDHAKPRPNKKPSSGLFVCKTCNGTGKVQKHMWLHNNDNIKL